MSAASLSLIVSNAAYIGYKQRLAEIAPDGSVIYKELAQLAVNRTQNRANTLRATWAKHTPSGEMVNEAAFIAWGLLNEVRRYYFAGQFF